MKKHFLVSLYGVQASINIFNDMQMMKSNEVFLTRKFRRENFTLMIKIQGPKSKLCYNILIKIDCDETLVENQNKCVGDNCETWKCFTFGKGTCSNNFIKNSVSGWIIFE